MSLFYKNPIIHADYADPDIIRTGGDFWLVSSSFNHVPGLPLLHSRDLIHWTLVNHVVPRLPFASYNAVQPGKGIWAPSIRYHAGRYWVFFSTPDEGIFVCHSTDPLGEWSAPHCLQKVSGWIDPCPFWDDDGRAWLVHAFAYSRSGIKNKLQLIEMAPDASRLLDDGQIIFDGTPSHPTLEGPKLYKRAGEYWIFAPAGGVKRGWQTVLRAARLQGPWESRDVLHQGDTSVNGPHQGGWVALENGEDWFLHFQDKGLYGRIVHLQPLRWLDDGWPLIGETSDEPGKGQPVLIHPIPDLPYCPGEIQSSDDFADGRPGKQWQWQANPADDWISPGRPGLRLRCAPLAAWNGVPALYTTPQLLLQKFPAVRFSVCCGVTPHFLQPGDEGGLMVYGERYAALTLYLEQKRLWLGLRHGWISERGILTEHRVPVADVTDYRVLALACDVGDDGICHFRYHAAGQAWATVSPRFSAGAGKWVGAKMGIYAASTNHHSNGNIHFDYFTVKKK
ncbi:glycoside hydrolase 43 family protein [Sodalis sp. RH22]|uniref:glycoside hydrolase family 43 protein n=1 Tax=unclassified Sodalis (in: enterobacteria) TaxID=2636512 RepID=UPI0039B50E78